MNNQCAAVSNLDLQEYGCPHCGSKNMTRFFECGNMTIFICKECLCETAAICDGKESCVEFLEENKHSGFCWEQYMSISLRDQRVIEKTAEQLAEKICEIYGSSEQSDQIVCDLARALKYTDFDGYRIARYLESTCYWDDIDFQIVELLDSSQMIASDIAVKLLKEND